MCRNRDIGFCLSDGFTRFIDRIRMEHIESIYRKGSKLEIGSLCSTSIRSRTQDIAEKLQIGDKIFNDYLLASHLTRLGLIRVEHIEMKDSSHFELFFNAINLLKFYLF